MEKQYTKKQILTIVTTIYAELLHRTRYWKRDFRRLIFDDIFVEWLSFETEDYSKELLGNLEEGNIYSWNTYVVDHIVEKVGVFWWHI